MELLARRGRRVALLGAFLLAGCGQREEPAATTPPPIETPAAAERAASQADDEDVAPARAAQAPESGAATLTLTDEDDGRTLQLQKGQAVVVNLPADRASGMTWIPAGNALPVVATDGLPRYETDSNAGGAGPGIETWRFVAEESGQAELVFEYRSLRGGDRPMQTLVFRFDVE